MPSVHFFSLSCPLCYFWLRVFYDDTDLSPAPTAVAAFRNKNQMTIETLLTPSDLPALARRDLRGTACVVFDILRATSTFVTALHHGAKEIIPVSEIAEAVARRTAQPEVLLAGERDGVKIRAAQAGGIDFDFGNSPREFTPERVRGQLICLRMVWFTDRHFFLLAVAFYGLSTLYSVFLWRKGFRRDEWVNYFLLAAGVALHTLAMIKRGLTLHSCPVNNLYEATTFLLWALGLACLIYSLLPRFKFLAAFTAPVLFTVGDFCADAVARSAARTEAGFFQLAAQPARGDDPASLRRVRPRGGRGGNVFDAAA
jgi:hypothetical protein